MEYKDYYKTLGVDRKADAKDIRSAYRKLARQYHPDVNPGDKASEERFKEVNEAYEVLSDAEKRAKYDRFGAEWQQFAGAGGRPEDFDWGQWSARPGAGAAYSRTMTQEDLEEMLGGLGGFSDFFETLFGRGQRRATAYDASQGFYEPRARIGRDVEHRVQISLEEAFHGATRTLEWEDGRRIEAKIPRGVRSGSRIRLGGQGQPGVAGASAGDLYLRVEVMPHPVYAREGDDLKMTAPVDLYTCLLGGTARVAALDRTVELTIPPETANGRIFRLRGLGMPQLQNPDERGDLYVTVEVSLPQQLSQAEKDLYQKLRQMRRA